MTHTEDPRKLEQQADDDEVLRISARLIEKNKQAYEVLAE